ncbi:MAG TPA: transposase, partial [Dehalococcoidia bacterium]|nr:transposase [Dehalococcoidia bacterium]
RKVPGVLETLAGLKLTQGAITQDALRRARGQIGIAYQQLRRAVRESPAVYTDDTGWRVDGQNAHLMAFDTDEVTVYQVRPRHRHQEVQEVVPVDYQGVMVTDRGRSYEAHSFRKDPAAEVSSSSPEDPERPPGEEKGAGSGAWREPQDAVWDGDGPLGGVPP